MEGQYFKEMPKFKSPEEELDFLRAHIAKREKELSSEGSPEKAKEEATKETIREYKAIEPKQVLHKTQIVESKDVEGIVLRLKPEPHDAKMEELLGFLITKGLKNTLSVLEGMGNPHLDDDFHRFLIQYIHSKNQIPGLVEKTPVWKALHMTLFEIMLPVAGGDESKKGFKEFISAMEQFYSGMQSISEDKDNTDRNYYTLEIALSSQTDEVVVYASVPNQHIDLFEKQVLAFYHDAKVKESVDDYNIFSEGGASAGSYAKFAEKAVLPIKTYEAIEHDPMNTILNTFSKLKSQGEGAAIQFVIAPAGNTFIKKFNSILDDVKKGMSVKKAYDMAEKFHAALFHAAKDIFSGESKEEKEKNKKIDDIAIGKISEKVKSTILDVSARVIASASTKDRADQILHEIESSFNQFNEASGNSITFEKMDGSKLKQLLHDFSYRLRSEEFSLPMNLKELSSVFHFPVGVESAQLKEVKAGESPAPLDMPGEGVLLGINSYRGRETQIRMSREDRVRHFYVIGQTGTGKTTILKNMVAQDIKNGEGVCFMDPHGTDIQEILSYVPKERIDDVIYFDPSYTARPMGLNMLEYDVNKPDQKIFVVNELLSIFKKLYGATPESMGPAFEQYFRNSAMLVMEHPESGNTLLEISRVMADAEFRKLKLSHCKNPIIKQFWQSAESTTGEGALANYVPYITNKFDVFLANDVMRPVVLQEKSVFDFRKIMDEKKILLINLAKGKLGEINSNLIGLIIVGKIQMAALSRVDMFGQKLNDFYLYIDEFQNVTTDSIASILSEARKYRLSLNVAHQYINQLEENIKDAVFGNVGSMAVYRVSPEDAEFLEKKFSPTFSAKDITKLDNFNSYVNMLVRGTPSKPFSMTSHWSLMPKGNIEIVDDLKQLSYLKYGRDRAEVEEEIMSKYNSYKS